MCNVDLHLVALLGANKANGQRLTPADKKHAVLLALQTWPERSGNQIAEQVGCDVRCVARLKDEFKQNGTCPNLPDRVTGQRRQELSSQFGGPNLAPRHYGRVD